MAQVERRVTSLDLLVLVVAMGALLVAAYELNLSSLGRRLVAETAAWLREQRSVSRETSFLDEQPEQPVSVAEQDSPLAEQPPTSGEQEQPLAERDGGDHP